MTEQQGNEKTSTAAQSLTLRVKLGPQGVARFQEFLSGQHQRHADAQSLFPGYDSGEPLATSGLFG